MADALANLFGVEGKTFLVTGGSGFICSYLVDVLLSLGAHVASFDQAARDGFETSDRFAQFMGDATKADDVNAAMTAAEQHFGSVDFLINGAGINIRGAVAALQIADFEKVMDVNLLSALHFSRAFAALEHPGERAIVNFGSIAGLHGIVGAAAYSASKAAVLSFTQVCALEFAARKIRVNALAPSALRSPMMAARLNDPAEAAALIAKFPLGRLGTPADLVGTVLFFCSPAAQWITGQFMVIDGGRTATA